MEDTSSKSGNERALEFHNFERTVLSTIEGGAIGEHIAALETALLHHAAGSRVVDEKVAPDDTGPDLAGAAAPPYRCDGVLRFEYGGTGCPFPLTLLRIRSCARIS